MLMAVELLTSEVQAMECRAHARRNRPGRLVQRQGDAEGLSQRQHDLDDDFHGSWIRRGYACQDST